MGIKTFSKPPLTSAEKEKRAQEIIQAANKNQAEEGKLSTKSMLLRMPETYYNDLKKISRVTGLSRTAICLELLRPGIKQMMRELEE